MKKRILLTEGGLAGHIMHLYDDLDLTFGKLKEIISGISDGSITSTEKLDGYNIFMTIRKQKCFIARNKEEISQGGINLDQLSNKQFSGGKDVARIFWEASQVFENAFIDFPRNNLDEIFGEQGNIFYNFEIVTKETQNLINYDSDMLILLPVGHIMYDFMKNKISSDNVDEYYERFYEIIEELNNVSKDLTFSFSTAPKITNSAPDLGKKCLDSINILQKEYKMSDFSKIKDYYKENIKKNLSKLPHFDIQKEEIKQIIADLVLGDKNTKDIPHNFNETDRNFVSLFTKTSKNSKKILEVSKWPLEKTLHDFSVAYLNQIEVHEERLGDSTVIDTLKKAIKAIKSYDGEDHEEAKAVLDRNLSKITNIDDINEYIEGLVFQYEEKTYKLTGNFAPANQIIGLYKYGRGKIPALSFKNDNESDENLENTQKLKENEKVFSNDQAPNTYAPDSSVALFPGSFKPPHAGHAKVVRKLLDLKNAQGEIAINKVVIMISPKERYSNDYKIFVDAEKSQEIWKLFFPNEGRIEVQICDKSPVQAVYDALKNNEHGEQNYILVVSQKDKNDNRFSNIRNYAPDVNVKLAIMPSYDSIDSTKIRQTLSMNDYNSFINFMPIELDKNVVRGIWSILKNHSYNNMYDKFNNDINNTDSYQELKKRYPTLVNDKKFIADMVLKEETRKFKNKIYGGLADKKQPKDFDEQQLAKGAKVEMEHTNDKKKAIEIAMDHLTEDPQYYSKLEKAKL